MFEFRYKTEQLRDIVNLQRIYEALTNVIHEDSKDPFFFSYWLDIAMIVLSLSEDSVAHEFSVSLPTVIRWRDGKNAPVQPMRTYVFEYLLKEIENYFKEGTILQNFYVMKYEETS